MIRYYPFIVHTGSTFIKLMLVIPEIYSISIPWIAAYFVCWSWM